MAAIAFLRWWCWVRLGRSPRPERRSSRLARSRCIGVSSSFPEPTFCVSPGLPPTTNVFTPNAPAAERRLEALPWIADVTITKHLPRRWSSISMSTWPWRSRTRRGPEARRRGRGAPRRGRRVDPGAGSGCGLRPPMELPIPMGRRSGARGRGHGRALRRQIAQVSVMADGELPAICGPERRSRTDTAEPRSGGEGGGAAGRAPVGGKAGRPVLSADVRVPATPSARFECEDRACPAVSSASATKGSNDA